MNEEKLDKVMNALEKLHDKSCEGVEETVVEVFGGCGGWELE
jgi:hypothetical protein